MCMKPNEAMKRVYIAENKGEVEVWKQVEVVAGGIRSIMGGHTWEVGVNRARTQPCINLRPILGSHDVNDHPAHDRFDEEAGEFSKGKELCSGQFHAFTQDPSDALEPTRQIYRSILRDLHVIRLRAHTDDLVGVGTWLLGRDSHVTVATWKALYLSAEERERVLGLAKPRIFSFV